MSQPRRFTAPKVLATASFVWAAGVGIWLATWPCFYSGTSSVATASSTDPTNVLGQTQSTCSSLIAVNGKWVLFLLAVPIVITAIGLLGALKGRRWLTLGPAVLLFALCVVGLMSIGMAYIPAALALIVAGGLMGRNVTPAVAAVV
jgi:hypothetical protein